MELIDPNDKYLVGYKEAYVLSLDKIRLGEIESHDLMFKDSDKVDIINKLLSYRDTRILKAGQVVRFDYFLVDGPNFLGTISIRLALNDELMRFGGNIGYGINPKFWHKGYGNKILELCLVKAKKLGLSRVLITCDDTNIASARII